ncbi:ABC1 kinase family protein [Jongsikchunia kroppenstedtii]|uniref:ABC1 kinase family protein n=1 Tax=Jongsikchunia kroppenstedtii TaxID=1121721 RepID=UPI0003A5B00C|nr:AarF/UbiB family protein [Jongsikchunia kroppenstedtii]
MSQRPDSPRSIGSRPADDVLMLQKVPAVTEIRRVGSLLRQAGRAGVRLARPGHGKPLKIRAAQQTRESFARLGPTYVKLGQLIASSPGVFPLPLSREFRSMLDRVPPADPAEVRRVLIEQLGDEPEKIFARFDSEPIASASIAQVHTATLRSGADVVVKIQRPGIRMRLASDVQLLARAAKVARVTSVGKVMNAPEIVEDFTQNLNEELDFRAEARAMEEWQAAVADTDYADRVRVAKVYHEYTTERVLTMERITATRIDDLRTIRAKKFDGTRLVKTLLLSLLDTGLNQGIFHGDLHAGNVLVDDDGRIVLLDFGIVGRFDERSRKILCGLVIDLLVRSDHEAAVQKLFELGAVPRHSLDGGDVGQVMKNFTDPLATTDMRSLSYADLGKQLMDLAKEYDLRLPRELVLVGKQLLYVERYMKLLAPRWTAISDPELFAMMARLMKDVERERRAAVAAAAADADTIRPDIAENS